MLLRIPMVERIQQLRQLPKTGGTELIFNFFFNSSQGQQQHRETQKEIPCVLQLPQWSSLLIRKKLIVHISLDFFFSLAVPEKNQQWNQLGWLWREPVIASCFLHTQEKNMANYNNFTSFLLCSQQTQEIKTTYYNRISTHRHQITRKQKLQIETTLRPEKCFKN